MSGDSVKTKPGKWILATLTFSHIAQHFYAGIPVLFQSIRTDLFLSYTDIGLMTGTNNIIGGFLQFVYSIAGRLLPRRILLGSANLAMGLGCLLMGLADRFTGLLVGNIIGGAGQAGQHPVGVSIIVQKFGKKRVAETLSIFYGLGYIGNIISPILLSTIAILTNWRFSLFFLTLIPLITGFNVLYYLRREPASGKQAEASHGNLRTDIMSSIKIKGAVFVIIAQTLIVGGTGMGIIVTWIPQFLQDPAKGLGLNLGEAGLITAIATLGGVVGTIIIGRLANRFGHLRTAMMCLCSTIVTVYLLSLYCSFTPILVLHLFIIGVTTFSIPTLLQSYLTTISTTSNRDILLGLFFTFGFGVSSIWSTLIGTLIDEFSFNAAWTLMSTLGLLAFFMLLSAYRCHRS